MEKDNFKQENQWLIKDGPLQPGGFWEPLGSRAAAFFSVADIQVSLLFEENDILHPGTINLSL